ncbi:hypothetical protein V2A60_005829 [Cordyceps javanica]
MSIPRRPVALNNNPAVLSPFPEPSPTASISSLISAYSRPYASPTTTATATHGGAYPDTPLASSREASPPPHVPDTLPERTTSRTQLPPPPPISKTPFLTDKDLPLPMSRPSLTDKELPPPMSKLSLTDKDVPPPISKMPSPTSKDAPPAPLSKPELWRRRPQNDSREIPGLKLNHSHGSTVSSAGSGLSTSTASTQRPSTAVQDESPQSRKSPPAIQDEPPQSRPAETRKPPSVGGLPGRNVRPSTASKDASRSSNTPAKSGLNAVQSKPSLPSLRKSANTPPTNRPPTPEYQNGESRAAILTTFTSPISPASSPESPNRFSPTHAKELPPPPLQNPARGASDSTAPKLGPAAPSSILTDMPRRKPATGTLPPAAPSLSTMASLSTMPSPATMPSLSAVPSPATASLPINRDPLVDAPHLSAIASPSFPATPNRARTPVTASAPSDQSRGSSLSPTRQPRRDQDQTPRQQRRPYSDQRIVQTEQGPMYRGRDGTLYPEMKIVREADPRAFRFPAWKGKETAAVSADGVYPAPELKETHYSCFQRHATMNRRPNRHYPLTCQTCNKPDAEDRWACTFCHLRICEPCFRTLDTNQRQLKTLVADIDRRTTLRLSSDSRPASAFGL